MTGTSEIPRDAVLTTPLRFGKRSGGRRTRALRRGLRLDYGDTQFESHDTVIRNGRPQAGYFSLDREGFEFVAHESAVGDFFDEAELAAVYYPEIEALVKSLTGAARVVIFDHTLRAGDEALREQRQIREPVPVVHNDYTENSAPQRVRDLLPDEAEALLRHRFQIVQVWRPVNVPAVRSPLAICDASSLGIDDLLLTELHYEHRVGEIYHVGFNPAQRWFYFPDMRPDEALVFKVYESLTDGRARYTAHGAFDVPGTPADAPPRQSIEVRSLVFFDGDD